MKGMDPRKHIGIGVEFVTGMGSACFIGFNVRNAESLCILMDKESKKY